ncbi:transposase [Paraburkholderia strydomiana]|jgi:transposase|uniref:transposase n=1 Tax=Paraburkholderia strydomiana TaxID=1245417 RepID=UPI0038B7AB6B
MSDRDSELRVIRQSSDGRRRYDENGKRALVEIALRSDVSVAKLALEHGINANLLRKWITKYLLEREGAESSAPQGSEAEGIERSHTIEMVDPVAVEMPGTSMRKAAVESTPSAFVPVVTRSLTPPGVPAEPIVSTQSIAVALHVRLPNGVEFDIGEAKLEELATIIDMLGRLPCSGSTKG